MATTEKSKTSETESFAALFEESMALKEMRQGEIITAEVISVESDFIIVNAGLKSESVIKTEEFLDDKGDTEVQVGDFVKVAIEKLTKKNDFYLGQYHKGGIVFYVDSTGEHGLVCTPTDIMNQSNNQTDYYNAVSVCQNLKFNGYTDWYLPSKYQLNLISSWFQTLLS